MAVSARCALVLLSVVVALVAAQSSVQYYELTFETQKFSLTVFQNQFTKYCNPSGSTCGIKQSGGSEQVGTSEYSTAVISFDAGSATDHCNNCMSTLMNSQTQRVQFLESCKGAGVVVTSMKDAAGPRSGGGNSGSDDNGALVFIIVGCVAAVILIGLGLAVFLVYRRSQSSAINRDTMQAMLDSGTSEEERLGRSRDPNHMTPEDRQRYEELCNRIQRFMERYDKTQLGKVQEMARKFFNREEQLFSSLVERYGPEPARQDEERRIDVKPSSSEDTGSKAPPPSQAQFNKEGSSGSNASPTEESAPKAPPPSQAQFTPAEEESQNQEQQQQQSDEAASPSAPPPSEAHLGGGEENTA